MSRFQALSPQFALQVAAYISLTNSGLGDLTRHHRGRSIGRTVPDIAN